MIRYLIPIVLCCILWLPHAVAQKAKDKGVAQAQDSTKAEPKKHSPFKATIMSTALPGLGQVYNGRWWKVPIIYGAFGGLIYSAVANDLNCRTYLNAYLTRIDDDPNTTDQFVGRYSDANLRELVDRYQRNRDISLIFTGVVYALNIIDAAVDAHLKDFDVSDDLSLRVQPTLQQTGTEAMPMPAVALTLRLR